MLSANEKNNNKTHLLRAPWRKSRPQLRGMQCHMSRVRPILRLIHEYLQTRGLGPYATGPGGRGHKSSRPHPSCGRGRGRGGVFGQFPPPNLPPDLPRGQFHNGPRHDFSAGYPYGNVNRGYSGGGQQRGTGHHHGRTRTDMGSRDTRGALARALTATLEAGTVSAILPTTGIIFDSSGRPPAIIRAKRVSN